MSSFLFCFKLAMVSSNSRTSFVTCSIAAVSTDFSIPCFSFNLSCLSAVRLAIKI